MALWDTQNPPVSRDIYDRFSSTKYLYSEIEIADTINKNVILSEDDSEFVNFVLENYLKYSGAELERLSHSETPWIQTRGSLGQNELCDKVIMPNLMIDYYGEKWTEINK